MIDKNKFLKQWHATRGKVLKFAGQAVKAASKGEKTISKLSQKGKNHLHATALQIQKEHMYHLIGHEYLACRKKTRASAQLKKLVKEFEAIEKMQKSIVRRHSKGNSK